VGTEHECKGMVSKLSSVESGGGDGVSMGDRGVGDGIGNMSCGDDRRAGGGGTSGDSERGDDIA
jgi:hypothetical protein